MLPFRMRLYRFLVVFVCCWSWQAMQQFALAQSGPINYTASGGVVVGAKIDTSSPANFSRTFNAAIINGVKTGGVIVNDGFTGKVGLGTAAMNYARTVPWGNVAAAASRWMGYAGVGAAVYVWMNDTRCRNTGTSLWYMECDPGAAATGTAVCWTVSTYGCRDTAQHLADAVLAANQGNGCFYVQTSANIGSSSATFTFAKSPGDPAGCTSTWGFTGTNTGGSGVCPSGQTLGKDGKCSTGSYSPVTQQEVADKIINFQTGLQDRKDQAVNVLQEAIASGKAGEAEASPQVGTLSGPATVTGPATTTTTSTPGQPSTTETKTPAYNITYQGDTFTYTTTNTTTNNTTNTTTTTTNAPPTEVCGLPGKPECNVKVNETGTPTFSAPTDPRPALETADTTKRNETASGVTAPTFGFIGAPALAECTPFEFPNGIPPMNPCGAVDSVRSIMAYLWALAAGWISLGMIRRTISGG